MQKPLPGQTGSGLQLLMITILILVFYYCYDSVEIDKETGKSPVLILAETECIIEMYDTPSSRRSALTQQIQDARSLLASCG